MTQTCSTCEYVDFNVRNELICGLTKDLVYYADNGCLGWDEKLKNAKEEINE